MLIWMWRYKAVQSWLIILVVCYLSCQFRCLSQVSSVQHHSAFSVLSSTPPSSFSRICCSNRTAFLCTAPWTNTTTISSTSTPSSKWDPVRGFFGLSTLNPDLITLKSQDLSSRLSHYCGWWASWVLVGQLVITVSKSRFLVVSWTLLLLAKLKLLFRHPPIRISSTVPCRGLNWIGLEVGWLVS